MDFSGNTFGYYRKLVENILNTFRNCAFWGKMLYDVITSGAQGYTQNSLDSQNVLKTGKGNLRISKQKVK